MRTCHPVRCHTQVRVWVWADAGAYAGANFTWASGYRPPNVTRCVDPPRYDPYAQQLTWRLAWCAGGGLKGVSS